MAKEAFAHPETSRLLSLLDETSQRSGVSRGQAFEDFLHMTICALSGGQMEDQYLAVVKRYADGKKGKRGCDSIARMFGELIEAMEQTRADILGDLFQGAITYGEAGQFLTPPSVCEMMARMVLDDAPNAEGVRRSVLDPCCGSGRMLLAAAELRPGWEYVGQDVDLRCVRMTAINLALRNRYGHVIWGNSLTNERRLAYQTGFNFRGVIRELSIEDCPAPVREITAKQPLTPSFTEMESRPNDTAIPDLVPGRQLRLF